MIINIARRAYDHNWNLDPITRSLLDTDFYKLLMLQLIWKLFPKMHAAFSLLNRTTSVRLGEIVDIAQLREQLCAQGCQMAAISARCEQLARHFGLP